MVNRMSVVGALGLGLAILGVIARYIFHMLVVVNMTTMFVINQKVGCVPVHL